MEEFLLTAKQDLPDTWEYQVAVAAPDLESWTGLQLSSSNRVNKSAKLQTSLWKVNWGLQTTEFRELDYVIDFLKRILPRQ